MRRGVHMWYFYFHICWQPKTSWNYMLSGKIASGRRNTQTAKIKPTWLGPCGHTVPPPLHPVLFWSHTTKESFCCPSLKSDWLFAAQSSYSWNWKNWPQTHITARTQTEIDHDSAPAVCEKKSSKDRARACVLFFRTCGTTRADGEDCDVDEQAAAAERLGCSFGIPWDNGQ